MHAGEVTHTQQHTFLKIYLQWRLAFSGGLVGATGKRRGVGNMQRIEKVCVYSAPLLLIAFFLRVR